MESEIQKAEDFLKQFPPAIFKKGRARHIVAERARIVVELHDRYGWSFPSISKRLKYSNHTSALHLYRSAKPETVSADYFENRRKASIKWYYKNKVHEN